MLQCFLSDASIIAQVPAWLTSAWFLFQVLLGFSLIVFVHELGHFAAAKWAGVRVQRFAIGFGKELFGFTKGETRYSFNLLPLGGYVKMLGQEDFVVDKSGELKVKQDPHSFTNKSIGKRMVIITAGVVMNLIFAAIAFTIVVMVGQRHAPPIIGLVKKDAPAGRAGLEPGDLIKSINGDEIRNFRRLSSRIALSDPDEVLVMEVWRDGKKLEPPPRILPEYVKLSEVRQIGVGPGYNRRVWAPSFRIDDHQLENRLHRNDEIYAYLADGEVHTCKDLGKFHRLIKAARGEPVDIIVKRPKDPDALTDEQLLVMDLEIETEEVTVQLKAFWFPEAYRPVDTVSASLLGLVPRMTVLSVDERRSFAKAGVQGLDVITKIGRYDYPSHAELVTAIGEATESGVAIEVRRSGVGNRGLSAAIIDFCEKHREAWIVAALQDTGKAGQLVARLAQTADLPEADLQTLQAALADLATGSDWRRWLERVDIHTLEPIEAKRPFALFSNPEPRIDATLRCIDENHLVVANVVPKFGKRTTPAEKAGIPRGAVILEVDGKPVRAWHELTNTFRARSGKTVQLKYRLVDEMHTVRMDIPGSPLAALDLAPEDRIVKINGKSSCRVQRADGPEHELALPDWRAVETLLKASVGKTVGIEYVTAGGATRSASYPVTEENTDPWLARVHYESQTFICYPLLERHPVHDPVAALFIGVEEAYRATMQTIQSIRHMLFTRKVGLSKVSGPVGILRIGSQVAEAGFIELLWLLGLLSANLAVINFLPLPIVDGGLFLFLVLEKIRGEPVSIRAQIATQIIGITMIVGIFLLVTYKDIVDWITGA